MLYKLGKKILTLMKRKSLYFLLITCIMIPPVLSTYCPNYTEEFIYDFLPDIATWPAPYEFPTHAVDLVRHEVYPTSVIESTEMYENPDWLINIEDDNKIVQLSVSEPVTTESSVWPEFREPSDDIVYGNRYPSDLLYEGQGCNSQVQFNLPFYAEPITHVVSLKIEQLHEQTHYIVGEVMLSMFMHVECNKLILHASNITIIKISMDYRNEVIHYEFDEPNQFLIIYTDRLLHKSSYARLRIKYAFVFNKKQRSGFYAMPYFDEKLGKVQFYGVSSGNPTEVRKIFPCFDESHFQGRFRVQDFDYECETCGKKIYSFNTTAEFFIGPYEFGVIRPSKEVVANIYYGLVIKPSEMSRYGFVKRTVESVIRFLHSRTPNRVAALSSIDLDKLKYMLFVNRYMREYSTSSFSYKQSKSPAYRYFIATRIAKVVIHTLLGDTIRLKKWSDAWINVGLTNWLVMVALKEDPKRTFDQFRMLLIMNAKKSLLDDGLSYSSTALEEVDNFVYSVNHIADIYNELENSKATAVFMMLNSLMTTGRIINVVDSARSYYPRLLISKTEFWVRIMHLEPNPGVTNSSAFVKSWTHTSGYPYIVIETHPNNVILVHQYKFDYKFKRLVPSNFWIPLTCTTSHNISFENPKILKYFNSSHYQFDIPKDYRVDWIICNIQQFGYYRVMYENYIYIQLKNQLYNVNDHTLIHPLNRAQIIDDAFNFAHADLLQYRIPLEITKYLYAEKHYVPWHATLREFKFLYRGVKQSLDQRNIRLILDYFQDVLWPVYDRASRILYDSTLDSMLRQEIILFYCGYLNFICETYGFEYTLTEKAKKSDDISRSELEQIYCVMLSNGKDDTFLHNMYGRFFYATDRFVRMSFLKLFSCSTNETGLASTLTEYFMFCLSDNATVVDVEDLGTLIENIADKYPLIISDFIRSNFAELKTLFSLNQIVSFFKVASYGIFIESDAHTINEFVFKHRFSTHHGYKKLSGRMEFNVQWLKTKLKDLIIALSYMYA